MNRFSAHLQLQYLIQSLGINARTLNQAMTQYYNTASWQLKQTQHGRVTGVTLVGPRPERPPGLKPRREPGSARPQSQRPQPTITIKRRRVIER